MEKKIARQAVSLVKRIASAISSAFACGNLTPAQKAKLEDMDKDYEKFLRHRRKAPNADINKF